MDYHNRVFFETNDGMNQYIPNDYHENNYNNQYENDYYEVNQTEGTNNYSHEVTLNDIISEMIAQCDEFKRRINRY